MEHRDAWIAAVSDLLAGYLLKDTDDCFEAQGRAHLALRLGHCFDQSLPVRLVLPGFPCKSPNAIDQTFGVLPDYGEVIAIERLDQLGQAIAALHAPGCVVSILSDGTTFNDIVGVADDVRVAYNRALRELCTTHTIQWVSMEDLFPQAQSAESVRASLVKQARLPWKNLGDLIEKSREDESLSQAHDHLCSHLYNDLRLCREEGQSEDEYLQQINFKAYQMMYRGQALNAAVDRFFGDDIRLSVHQYSNAGPKFTFGLAEGLTRVYSPWHAVPVCNLDGSQTLRTRAQVDLDHHVLVTYDGRPWLYHQTENPHAQGFEYELQKLPLFGLVVRDPLGLGFERLSTGLLEALVETFGFVCLKGSRFDDQDSFARSCERFGTLYEWAFGAVHVVKPADKPQGVVHSLEKTPLHWDLNMLPDSDAQVQRNPEILRQQIHAVLQDRAATGRGPDHHRRQPKRTAQSRAASRPTMAEREHHLLHQNDLLRWLPAHVQPGGSSPPQRRTHPALPRGHRLDTADA